MLDSIALWIGYVVMSTSGIACAVLLIFWAFERVYDFYTRGQDAADLIEAIEEWRVNHPDKFAKQRERHGG